jgi:tetratricopeptide (TPR) repeat protein
VFQALLLLPIRVVRLPFDVLFLTWDFLTVTAWGIQNLPTRLSGGPTRPFRACFKSGIIEDGNKGKLWHCPLAPKYGTKSALRLLFARLTWHTGADGQRSLCWHGSSSEPPTTWGRYLLAGVALALAWGVPLGALAWHYRHRLPFMTLAQEQPVRKGAATPRDLQRDPEMSARFVIQAEELERSGKTDAARTRFRDAIARDPTRLDAHLGVGRTSLEIGLTDDARQAFAKAMELDAADPRAMLGMARVLHAQGADRKALELLQAIIDRTPTVAEAHALKATCLMTLGEMADATTAIEKALALAPDDEAAITIAADLELRQGHFDAAETYYRALVDKNTQNLTGRLGLARILRLKGNHREAEVLLRALLVEKPGELRATEELVEVLQSSGRPLEGLALCRETIDKQPSANRLREKHLALLFGLGRDNDLYAAATKLLAESPGNLAAHTQMAAMFLRKNLPAPAIEHCNKALAQQPALESAYRLLTTALLQAGDIEAAKERLERLLAVLPEDLDAIVKLAECHRRRGDSAKAVELLRQAVEHHPGSSLARSQLAQAQFLAGDVQGAVAEFREAYRLAPGDAKALNNLAAAINYTNGDLTEALTHAEQAHKLEPRNPQILDTLAWVQARRGSYDQALRFSELAVALQPDMPIFRYHYGAILANLGRQDEAIESVKAAVQFGGEFQGSAEARELLQKLSGDASAAPPAQ